MAFQNEYVPDDDVIRYRVAEIWARYHGPSPNLTGFRYSWTVDRERNAFMMRVKSGREERSNRITFVLVAQGSVIEAELEKKGTGDLRTEPVVTVWALRKLTGLQPGQMKEANIRSLLKEALAAYKVAGILVSVGNHNAVFEF